jgi:signal transduction histidine kinase
MTAARLWAGCVGAALAVAPRAAWATEGVAGPLPGWMISLLMAAVLAMAAWSMIRTARARERARAAEAWGSRVRGLLASAPAAYLVVGPDGKTIASEGLRDWFSLPEAPASLAALEPVFAAQPWLKADVEALSASGKPFERLVTIPASGKVLQAKGVSLDPVVAGDGGVVVWLQDVTEDSQSLAKATAEVDRLTTELDASKALLESAPFPVWRRDAGLRLRHVNAAYVKAVEARSAIEAVTRGLELVNSALAAAPGKAAQRARDQGQALSREEYVVIGGDRRTLQIIDVPLADGGVGGFALDVTERDAAKAELARHLDAQTETLDTLSTPVAIFSREKKLTFHNSAFANLFRLDTHWLSDGPHHADVLRQMETQRRLPDQSNFQEWSRKVMQQYTELMEAVVELWHLPDDTTLRVITQPHPLGGLMLLFEDMTAQLSLARNYDTLIKVQQATLNNLHEGVAVFGDDGLIKLSNHGFGALLGLDPEEVAEGQHLDRLLERARPRLTGADDAAGLRQTVLEATSARKGGEGRLSTATGQVLDYRAVPLPDGAALLTCMDVTASQRIERALRERAEALVASDKLKNEFINNMSYEFRTPLTSIIGFAEMLELGYIGPVSEKQSDYLRNILASADRLQVLINDVLDLAATETGALALELSSVAAEPLVRAVADMTAEQCKQRGLDLAVEIAADAGAVQGDERRLKQVLYNLVSNAMRFTPKGGRVSIQAQALGDKLLLEVADTGVGISPEDQAVVFDRFRRGGNRGQTKGLGVGLALVKQFVDLHHGELDLDSAPGKGTRVRVLLPRVQPAADPAA